MVDRYWRKIEDVENDIENSMQISSILLKLKENDKKLGDLSKIGNNENNISSNLGKIDTNKSDISSNLGKIDTNKNDISFNLEKINTNDNIIVEINSNLNNIKNDLSDSKINKNISNYSIQNLFIYNIDVENDYILNKDNPEFSIFIYNLGDDFKSNLILEINYKLLYDYTTYNNIGTLMHVFKLYDENDTLLHEYKNLKTNSGDNLKYDLNQIDLFYVKLNDNYSIIKIELVLSILDNIDKSVSCKLYNSLKSNYLCVKYYEKINVISVYSNLGNLENTILTNSFKIDTNENDISTNLTNININEDNIAYNLREINYIKNNISKPYLNNIYNVLFYESKTQIDFRGMFFEKVFDVNANKNDFVEMSFKIELQYQDTYDRNYVKTINEIYDDDDNSLYIKSVNNNNYLYFSNRIIAEESIFIILLRILKK